MPRRGYYQQTLLKRMRKHKLNTQRIYKCCVCKELKHYDEFRRYPSDIENNHKICIPCGLEIGSLGRARKLQACPSWVDKDIMLEIYRLAAYRNKVTGIRWAVDHIIPLQAVDACGLHVENNLQVVPAHLNAVKSNRSHRTYKWSDFFN